MMNKSTFIVKVDNQQRDTWQGEVTWAEENKKTRFRSILELLKLMHEAQQKCDSNIVKKAN
jgi:hypothetical protein